MKVSWIQDNKILPHNITSSCYGTESLNYSFKTYLRMFIDLYLYVCVYISVYTHMLCYIPIQIFKRGGEMMLKTTIRLFKPFWIAHVYSVWTNIMSQRLQSENICINYQLLSNKLPKRWYIHMIVKLVVAICERSHGPLSTELVECAHNMAAPKETK